MVNGYESFAFHVTAKPIGPICNLDCQYCFYLEKENLYPDTKNFRMSDEVLESYIRQRFANQNVSEVNFAWQGGEPTLLGLDFFRRVVELQKKYCVSSRRVSNAFQTNGILLDADWCQFFRENKFLVGLSIDGPRDLHDCYRVDHSGRPTFDRSMQALELLKRHGVEFNTLTVVNRENSRRPLEVYNFLKNHGCVFMQFIPLVECVASESVSAPPDSAISPATVTFGSVQSETWGEFLCSIFDEWVRHDVSQIYVQLFEVQLGLWLGLRSSLCVFSETCGQSLILEHNGDLYACDHYVYPKFLRGNILRQSMSAMAASAEQIRFGADKRDALPRQCLRCDMRFACNGACPKHRFMKTADGEDGLNYLCSGYKRFFKHIAPYMQQMVELLKARRSPALIMSRLARHER
ncbi:MAG: anaerobic sulfatase maturase [Planctomycetota bacterium]